MTKVKICGITNLIDAKNALNLGADFIGFNNISSSPRYMDLDAIEEIVKDFNDNERLRSVLLSEESSINALIESLQKLGLKIVQPYYKHSLKDFRSLKLLDIKVFQPLRVASAEDLEATDDFCEYADVIILDTKSIKTDQLGGTGESFDWDLFLKAETKTSNTKLALAGGLDGENISLALEKTKPYMVDVSSGLESREGIKSLEKMKDFLSKVRAFAPVESR